MRLAAFLAVFIAVPAQAHDEWNWIRNGDYADPKNPSIHCCSRECHAVPESDVKTVRGGWIYLPLNEFIPFSDAYVSERDEYWRCPRFDAKRSTRCFFYRPGGV